MEGAIQINAPMLTARIVFQKSLDTSRDNTMTFSLKNLALSVILGSGITVCTSSFTSSLLLVMGKSSKQLISKSMLTKFLVSASLILNL